MINKRGIIIYGKYMILRIRFKETLIKSSAEVAPSDF